MNDPCEAKVALAAIKGEKTLQRFARTVLGYAIPKIISMLAQSGFLNVAIPSASSRAGEIPQHGEEQFLPGELEDGGAVPWFRELVVPGAPPRFGQLVVPGAALLIVLGLLGYFVSTGAAHHAVTPSAPVTAKNAPVVVPPAPSKSAPAMAQNAPIATPHAPSIPDNFKTPGSQALFEGDAISVGGTIPDADRDRIISSLKSTLGPQFVFATIAGTGATETAMASPSLKSGVSGKKPVNILEQSTLNLPAIYFATNSAEVPSDSKAFLEQAAVLMKRLPVGMAVRISGFTEPPSPRRCRSQPRHTEREWLRHLPFCSQ